MREEDYLTDMYSDSYFPNFLVDKIKESIKKIYEVLENGETDLEVIQTMFYFLSILGISSKITIRYKKQTNYSL